LIRSWSALVGLAMGGLCISNFAVPKTLSVHPSGEPAVHGHDDAADIVGLIGS
jgi:hypothetical protein